MATRIQKETAQRMIDKLNGELDSLFQKQEMGKGGRMAQKCCRGGRLKKAQFGAQLTDALSNMFSGSLGAFAPQGMGANQALAGLGSGIGQGLASSGGVGAAYTPNNQTFGSKVQNFFQNPLVGKIGRGLGDAAYAGASFAPGMYNLAQGMQPAEQINYADYRNPEYNKSVGLMANRRYDPTAELEDVERTGAVYRQGIQNLPTSTGGLRNLLSSAATREQRQKGQILGRKQNIDLGYMGEEARFRAGLGAQDAATRFNVDDVNARNRASRRNFLGESMTNIQQVAMQNRLMRNQRQRDDRLFNLAQSMSPMYGYGDDYSLRFRG